MPQIARLTALIYDFYEFESLRNRYHRTTTFDNQEGFPISICNNIVNATCREYQQTANKGHQTLAGDVGDDTNAKYIIIVILIKFLRARREFASAVPGCQARGVES